MSKRRLFVLGAGASYAIGLPDAGTIINRLMSRAAAAVTPNMIVQPLNSKPPQFFVPLIQAALPFLARTDGRFTLSYTPEIGGEEPSGSNKSPPRHPLDLLSLKLFEKCQRELEMTGIDKSWVIDILQEAAAEVLYFDGCKNYAKMRCFAEHLTPFDTVLTFNWDIALETMLNELNMPFDITFYAEHPDPSARPTGEAVRIVKVHGSIDWILVNGDMDGIGFRLGERVVHCTHRIGAAIHTELPNGTQQSLSVLRLLTFQLNATGTIDWTETEQGWKAEPRDIKEKIWQAEALDCFGLNVSAVIGAGRIMIFPGSNRLRHELLYARCEWWARCAPEFDEIIVIGYSFPSYDKRAMSLLETLSKRSENANVTIVNPAAQSLPVNEINQVFKAYQLQSKGFLEWASAEMNLA